MLISARVRPGASRPVLWRAAEGLRVTVTEPAAGGAANKAVIALTAKTLGVAKGAVTIYRGAKSRNKILRVDGLALADVEARLPVQSS